MARVGLGPLAELEALLSPDISVDPITVEDAPPWKGAYVVAIRLDCPAEVSFAGTSAELPRGWYAYCGSANGPGGVGARLRRHFRRDKKRHWHVDALTIAASRIEAVAIEDAAECDLVERLMVTGRFSIPLPGFGSSDCARCASHLLGWQG